MKRYRDENRNVYEVEKATNGKWIVIRYNKRGNRKKSKLFPSQNKKEEAQILLNETAKKSGWPEVKNKQSKKRTGVRSFDSVFAFDHFALLPDDILKRIPTK